MKRASRKPAAKTQAKKRKQSSTGKDKPCQPHAVKNENESEPAHALLIPSILSVLFKHCERETLGNCRLVCSQWHDSSLKQWRLKTNLIFQSIRIDPGSQSYNRNYKKYRSTPPEFLDVIHLAQESNGEEDPYQILKYPFRNVTLSEWECPPEPVETAFNDFWNRYGGLVYELKIGDCEFQNVRTLEEIIYEKTMNLKKLTFDDCDFLEDLSDEDESDSEASSDESETGINEPVTAQRNLKCVDMRFNPSSTHDNTFPRSWIQFFRHFSNLESLTMQVGPHVKDFFNKILNAARCVRVLDPKNNLCLKYLDLFEIHGLAVIEHPPSIANHFEAALFPLETLKLDVGYKTSDSTIEKILRSVSGTLKTLILYQAPLSLPRLNFPFEVCMDSLEHLELHGPIASDLRFLRYTKNLKKLLIPHVHENQRKIIKRVMDGDKLIIQKNDMICDAAGLFDVQDLKAVHLKEFSLNIQVEKPENMELLESIMPNLEKLEIHISSQVLPNLWQQWNTTLKELRVISDESITDQAITGMPEGWTVFTSKRAGLPNLSDFKELEVFHLSILPNKLTNCTPRIPRITELAVTQGILPLPKLRFLFMAMKNRMSSSTLQSLTEKGVTVRKPACV